MPLAARDVLYSYRAFWDAYLSAADPMDPLSAELARYATGNELQTVRRVFVTRLSAHEVIHGTIDVVPRVVSVVEDTATVSDCYLDNTGIYDAATGKRKDAPTVARHLILASLVLDKDGRWKVSDLRKVRDGCTAA